MTDALTQQPREILLYDTLTRTKRAFEPLVPGEVSMYVCGITVYDLTHIGHARTFICFDTLQRVLKHAGYRVKFVRNHTDVDDKIIRRAAERGEEPLALSQHFIEQLDRDMGELGVEPADVQPKVSEHIDEIVAMVEQLVERGYAYASGGDVYYRVRSFEGYGKLSGRKLDDMEAGRSGRVDGEGELKEYPFDFALWKASRDGEPSWPSPWGPGRPGWHIECSAMSHAHLGESFDIHGGGQDLMFPHHENEIAQSEAATGCAPMARTWMHVAMLNVDGEKMSKSLGNFWTTRDALEAYHPEVLRYFMHKSHYRRPLDYSTAALNEATRAVYYLYSALQSVHERLERAGWSQGDTVKGDLLAEHRERLEGFEERLVSALCDDLNTALAISHLYDLAKLANELGGGKKKARADEIATMVALLDQVPLIARLLGVLGQDPAEAIAELRDRMVEALELDVDAIEAAITARNVARQEKDWARADAIRDELAAKHVELLDGADATTWRIKFASID